ncbi:MAG: GNAT family N-acetyltransferase [Lachnospiraceae bacterium]|nr:GNAT family N-acetyltransferase [Lachnospiraceae bacterium]
MDLSEYDGKYVYIRDIYGDSFSGRAGYGGAEFLECEYGIDEDGLFIEDCLICNSQIETIKEIIPHGTAELWTENLILRKYRSDDAAQLYECFEADPGDLYSWVMDVDDVIVGTIGAYDKERDHMKIRFCVRRAWQGRGFATEALTKVLEYLTQNEGISCVTARCAHEDIPSRRVLEKSGMKLVGTEKDGITADGRVYDKLCYEYRKDHRSEGT